MKRLKINEVLQVVIALLMTGGLASAMTPPTATQPPKVENKQIKSNVTHVEAAQAAPAEPPAVTWESNPNHCTDAQYISQEAPFSCIDKPQPAPVAATAAPAQAIAPSADCGDPHGIMAAAGVSEAYFTAVDYIVGHEGGWCGATRYNTGGSGAYGICQALPGGKMASAGADWATNPVTQLRWCDSYANARYGGWWASYNYWVANRLW